MAWNYYGGNRNNYDYVDDYSYGYEDNNKWGNNIDNNDYNYYGYYDDYYDGAHNTNINNSWNGWNNGYYNNYNNGGYYGGYRNNPSTWYQSPEWQQDLCNNNNGQIYMNNTYNSNMNNKMRSYDDELSYIMNKSETPYKYEIKMGFVENMNVPAVFYATPNLLNDIFFELKEYTKFGTVGGFLPALKQIANVASLPGIVNASIGLPDIHAGYGFAIGNVAAFDMENPNAIVSPGGVGFDINCGVRLIRSNLNIKNIDNNVQEQLANQIFHTIPVGVGASGAIKLQNYDLDKILTNGIDWAIEHESQIAWGEDKQHCEELGCMLSADASLVSQRAKSRGLPQAGTLGAGNHYIEIQCIDEIYKEKEAKMMGLNEIGQVCIMLHSGSRGLGHQVCTDYLKIMDNVMNRDQIYVNDRQLACSYISSNESIQYLKAMSAAANFAWVNRSCMTYLIRKSFENIFKTSSYDLEMNLVYDVSHNMAKQEQHLTDNGETKTLLVHRKGATRAMPAMHELTPQDYQQCGQPVLIGGSMGTHSYVLCGTSQALKETFGSCVHGAGRTLSRAAARRQISSQQVLNNLSQHGIIAKVANPSLVQEEADKSYKSIIDVVEACTKAGLSSPVARLKPIAVIKG